MHKICHTVRAGRQVKDKRIRPASPRQAVIASTPGQRVGPRTPDQHIIARCTGDGIV